VIHVLYASWQKNGSAEPAVPADRFALKIVGFLERIASARSG
jgi:hypothetical protein